MYRYQLKPYLRKRYKEHPYWRDRGYLGYEYTKDIYPEGSYHEQSALSYYANVVFYSKKQLRQVPAANGILLPVRFFDEQEM